MPGQKKQISPKVNKLSSTEGILCTIGFYKLPAQKKSTKTMALNHKPGCQINNQLVNEFIAFSEILI
jgi:hypothetical protein